MTVQATQSTQSAAPRERRASGVSPRLRADVLLSAGGAVVAAGLVVASLLVQPALFIIVVAGAVLVYLAAFHPKVFAITGLSAIILSNVLQQVVGPIATNTDEAVIGLAVIAFTTRRLIAERRIVLLPGMAWFLLFFVFGVLSSVVMHVSYSLMLQSLILIAKGLLFAFALAQLRWTDRDFRVLLKAGVVAIAVVAASGLANLAFPEFWRSIVGGTITHLGGVTALQGLFQHPAAFGRFTAVLAVAAVAYACVVRTSLGNAILIGVTVALTTLTLEVKSIVGLLAALGILTLRYGRPILIVIALCFGPFAIALIVPPLIALVGDAVETYIIQDSARSTMTWGSLAVATAYFPFGAGFGRFGSFQASVDYSPEYYKLGFDHVYGLGPGEKGMFLNDTQWPAIIGESGWLGAAAFAIGIVCVLVSLLRRSSPNESVLARWVRITGVGWLVLLVIESAAAPVFVSAPSFPFVFAVAGIVASLRAAARDEERATGLVPQRLPGSTARQRAASIG
ncbi:hypothetical protein [Leifsonia sp. Leaf264]|uniref:hypothetical protein n=1 Tax=Leifsonia sp. Leaf264 TaxID=1736314 RepID=UPI0006FEC7A0|nr:hypothetical protein [Leifsonia sp. Leaf264]KQO95389.1 hypothetical protein ASF30_20440 [Leifsonia sp. Leaf264]